METTGAAAALLVRQRLYPNSIRVMDAEAKDMVRGFWERHMETEGNKQIGESENREYYVPYALIAHRIVEHIIERRW